MNTDSDRTVKAINDLIETTLDSVNGYRHAAEGVSDPKLKALFSERAGEREELSRRLQSEVHSFGGDPEHEQSLLGRIHNKFAEIRGEVMGQDDSGVVDEVERGEDVIKARFEEAARDVDLPEPVRKRIAEEYASIKADHDSISALKHQLD